VLVSGGLDSAVTAALAAARSEVAFLHVNYGQKTEARELKSFNKLADYFKAQKRLVISLEYLHEIGGSALTDDSIDVPPGNTEDSGVPITYVPFRNAHFLSAAVSWGETIGAESVMIGAVEEDGAGYPDCREEFLKSFEEMVALGTRPETDIKIVAPLVHMNKSEIVRLGTDLKAPLHLTWSCYKEESTACGVCDSCVLRLKGFGGAGIEDPIPYATGIIERSGE
ncbi:MAG: 7-cyano-7-deazaguanine synthase QueC, partial [bacterium]|nr:7-cyano-7-deazaguanine synthase QueC [bacterium]